MLEATFPLQPGPTRKSAAYRGLGRSDEETGGGNKRLDGTFS